MENRIEAEFDGKRCWRKCKYLNPFLNLRTLNPEYFCNHYREILEEEDDDEVYRSTKCEAENGK
jgi:hypothetical protein